MCGLDGLRNLLGYRKGFIQRDRTSGDPIRQRRPLHQLQHQRPRALGFLDAVDGRNARVVEAGEDLGLPLEPRQPFRVSRECFGEDLERPPGA